MLIKRGTTLISSYPWRRTFEYAQLNQETKVTEQIGSCAPYNNRLFLKIPKNCTSFYRDCLTIEEVTYDPNMHCVVILRDPIDRWITGTVELLAKFEIDLNAFIKHYRDVLPYDRHTGKQSIFFPRNFNYNNSSFYLYHKNIIEDLKPVYFPDIEVQYRNASHHKPSKAKYFDMVREWAQEPGMLAKLNVYYKEDYELIERYCA